MSSDYQLEDTVFLPFTTRAFATGIPTVLTGTPAIDIYEDATATPIITGETLVASLNSVVGFNMITVTATAASGFEAGKSYTAIIEAGTVGGVSVVGEVVAHFTLDMSAAAKDLANGTDGLTALKTGIDAIPTTAMRGTDSAALATVCTETRLAELDAGNLPTDIAAIPTTAMRGTDSAALASVCTEARLAELDAGNLPTDIAAIPTTAMRGTDNAATEAKQDIIDTNVDTLITQIGTAGAGLTDLGGMSTAMKAEVLAEVVKLLVTQMTEDYAADGVAPELAQALFLIQQNIQECAIAGTTITTKKLDGSTTAATYTLDDGTSPTSRTRTT